MRKTLRYCGIDGLAQDGCISIAHAMEIPQSCDKPYKYSKRNLEWILPCPATIAGPPFTNMVYFNPSMEK